MRFKAFAMLLKREFALFVNAILNCLQGKDNSLRLYSDVIMKTKFFKQYLLTSWTSNILIFSDIHNSQNLLKKFREFPRCFSQRNVPFFSPRQVIGNHLEGLLKQGGANSPFLYFIKFQSLYKPVILTPGRYNGGQLYITLPIL